jgi:hypothetical protein
VLPISEAKIWTLPTAGATVSDQRFVNLFKSILPERDGFNANVVNLWDSASPTNNGDPVTCAWTVNEEDFPHRCIQFLFNIFGHVPENSKAFEILKHLRALADKAKSIGMKYAFLPTKPFSGNRSIPWKSSTTAKEFLDDMYVKHVYDYFDYFGLPVDDTVVSMGAGLPLEAISQFTEADIESLFGIEREGVASSQNEDLTLAPSTEVETVA